MIHGNILDKRKKQPLSAVFFLLGNVLLSQGEAPNYHRRRTLPSVFALRLSMNRGSLRHLRSLRPHVHCTLRASFARFLDLLVPRNPLIFFPFMFRPYGRFIFIFSTQKNSLYRLFSSCLATSYSRRGKPPTTIGGEAFLPCSLCGFR